MSIHLLNRYLHVVFFCSFGGSFKGFDNYHDCVKKKIKRVKGMEHLEENCQIKNINVLKMSFVISLIGFLMSIYSFIFRTTLKQIRMFYLLLRN